MIWRNRFFFLRIGRDALRSDTIGIWLIIRPRSDLVPEGYMIAGHHTEILFRLPSVSMWQARIAPMLIDPDKM